jgi:hypothetical protein
MMDRRLRCDVGGMGKCVSRAGAGVHAKGFQFFFPSSMGNRAAGSRTTVKSSPASKASLSKENLKIFLISVAVYWMGYIYIKKPIKISMLYYNGLGIN